MKRIVKSNRIGWWDVGWKMIDWLYLEESFRAGGHFLAKTTCDIFGLFTNLRSFVVSNWYCWVERDAELSVLIWAFKLVTCGMLVTRAHVCVIRIPFQFRSHASHLPFKPTGHFHSNTFSGCLLENSILSRPLLSPFLDQLIFHSTTLVSLSKHFTSHSVSILLRHDLQKASSHCSISRMYGSQSMLTVAIIDLAILPAKRYDLFMFRNTHSLSRTAVTMEALKRRRRMGNGLANVHASLRSLFSLFCSISPEIYDGIQFNFRDVSFFFFFFWIMPGKPFQVCHLNWIDSGWFLRREYTWETSNHDHSSPRLMHAPQCSHCHSSKYSFERINFMWFLCMAHRARKHEANKCNLLALREFRSNSNFIYLFGVINKRLWFGRQTLQLQGPTLAGFGV